MMEQPKEIKATSLSLSQERGVDGSGISWYPGVIPRDIKTEREVESSEITGKPLIEKTVKYAPVGISEQGNFLSYLNNMFIIFYCYYSCQFTILLLKLLSEVV